MHTKLFNFWFRGTMFISRLNYLLSLFLSALNHILMHFPSICSTQLYKSMTNPSSKHINNPNPQEASILTHLPNYNKTCIVKCSFFSNICPITACIPNPPCLLLPRCPCPLLPNFNTAVTQCHKHCKRVVKNCNNV